MSDSTSVFSTDLETVSQGWEDFLSDPTIASAISPDTVKSGDPQTFSAISSSFFGLKFSTAANDARFNQSGPYIDDERSITLLGLDSQAALTLPLSQVLEAFTGLPTVDDAEVITDIVNDISKDVNITLVNTKDSRNAMWCIPGQTPTTSTALIFTLPTDSALLGKVKQTIADAFQISIGTLQPLNFYFQRTSYGVNILDDSNKSIFSVSHSYDFVIQTTAGEFDFWLRLDPGGVSVSITQNKLDASDIWTKLQDLTATNGPPANSSSQPAGPDILSHIDLLDISLGKNFGGKFWWRIETVLEWGSATDPVLIGLSYDSLTSMFRGRLLTKDSFTIDQRLPNYTADADVLPRTYIKDAAALAALPDKLMLADVFPEAASLPSAVPDGIAAAEISYTSGTIGSTLLFSATLTGSGAQGNSVPAPFSWDRLVVSGRKTTPTSGAPKFAFQAFATFSLNPPTPNPDNYTPANLGLEVVYDTGSWGISGYVQNLQFGLLAGFFDPDPDVNDALTRILGKLTIVELDVLYTYKAKSPSSFLLSGDIQLGDLALRFFYQYVSSELQTDTAAADAGRKAGDPQTIPVPATGSSWSFEARLGAADGKSANIGEIVDSIVGADNGSSEIPDFVKGIEIKPVSGDESAISIKVDKVPAGAVFVLDINILGVRFSFIQISTGGTSRHILRLSVGKIPLIDKIPLINQLPQPFDQLLYLWVGGASALSNADLTLINNVLNADEQLMASAISSKPDPKAAAIQLGHHFVVVSGGKIVLDHVFGVAQDEVVTSPAKQLTAQSAEPVPVNAPSKGALTKTLGPLTISAVTLQYKDKWLWVHMDAILALGPISLGLLGFGIGFSTTGLKITNLDDILDDVKGAPSRFDWELHGMSLAFDRPPLELAGIFEHDKIPLNGGGSEDVYKGGIGVSFPPYTFVAVGEYMNITNADGSSYKSVFVFAKLDGPLVTLEFATISGVRLGFGFNSVVRSPSIDELTSFPFISNSASSGAGDNPMMILQAMEPAWVTPKLDSYWFGAGMTITAFDVISITAVAIFAFRDAGVVISIFADAVATMPPNQHDPNACILYVEIGLVAELNFIDGYFRVEASLAPTSFLLVPQCHLTGGFALVYWFGSNPNAGDFVFSIGGYHRAYTPPAYYPVPTRVGISFQIGDNIQMIGQSYFAITPKVAMAGALIHISLSVGPVSAYLDATFDALINFHPLHYIVDFSVSVGVECDIDIWFIHIHISIHIGADLHIEGPEFGGIAHVDFWFFGFDIHFGAQIQQPPPQPLLDFWETTHTPGPETADRSDNDPNPQQTLVVSNPKTGDSTVKPITEDPYAKAAFKFVLQQGNAPQATKPSTLLTGTNTTVTAPDVPSTGAGAKWFVKGGSFQFGIMTGFALSNANVAGTDEPGEGDISLPLIGAPAEEVFSRPMQVSTPLTSTFTILIEHIVGSNRKTVGGWLNVQFIRKAVPSALWALYDPALDLTKLDPRGAPPGDLLNGSKSTRNLALGVALTAPKPVLAISHIPAFNATEAAKAGVLDERPEHLVKMPDGSLEGDDWYIPAFEPVQTQYLAANLTDAEKKMDAPTLWKEMHDTWSSLAAKETIVDDDVDGLLVLAATEVFGWNLRRPQTETAALGAEATPWKLKGALPKRLIADLTDTYLALPRVGVQ